MKMEMKDGLGGFSLPVDQWFKFESPENWKTHIEGFEKRTHINVPTKFPCWVKTEVHESDAGNRYFHHIICYYDPSTLESSISITIQLYPTARFLPPEDRRRWILGIGGNISGNVSGRHSIMRYDGNWWNEDGTEMTDNAPEWWGYIPELP